MPTSAGNITIPQLGGTLSLHGRDSKIHVADYPVGDFSLLYSTAEIFTWKKHASRTTLVVYGGPNEHHELAVSRTSGATSVEGSGIKFSNRRGATILSWDASPKRRVVRIGSDLYIVILDRNSAYDYWTVSTAAETYAHEQTPSSELIVKAGYLLRNASISDANIHLTGDLNATTTLEVIAGAHDGKTIKGLTFNGVNLPTHLTPSGFLVSKSALPFTPPTLHLPDLKTLKWSSIDTLPELKDTYDDTPWVNADHTTTNNTYWPLTTPVVLWSSEYGFHANSILTRAHFIATGQESMLYLNVSGGSAMACSVWLNSTFLGSWAGDADTKIANLTLEVGKLVKKGSKYVVTVLSDHMGNNGNWNVGYNEMKTPRGVLSYAFPGHTPSGTNTTNGTTGLDTPSRAKDDLTWKITGNLGGETYPSSAFNPRGPLNEGALYVERHGLHLPDAPTTPSASFPWVKNSTGPTTPLSKPGVTFYTTDFDLDIPKGWDVPLSFIFDGGSIQGGGQGRYRAQIWLNGYHFGRYLQGIGPQTRFPVPEGILNYSGSNKLGVSIWALEEGGATPGGLELVAGMPVKSGYGPVEMSPMEAWKERKGAY